MILAGDIGGTNTRLALFDDKLTKLQEHVYPNAGRARFTEIVREFLQPSHEKINRAAIGVAGPVKNGSATMTNLPWKLDEQELARDLKIAKVALINDLVAHAEGIELLEPRHLIELSAGEMVPRGNRAIIAAGTGLGEAGIFWDPQQRRYCAFPSEGGHADFAPRDDRQIGLLKFLRGKYASASWERVLSGPGLRNIYDYLTTVEKLPPLGGVADPEPKEITAAALNGSSPTCIKALNMFVALYGAESANLALKVLATGGVYIGGGIAPHIVDKLASSTFLDAFFATGPENIRAVLRKVPINIVNFELNGLYGAANHASRL
jgi:glucokinase